MGNRWDFMHVPKYLHTFYAYVTGGDSPRLMASVPGQEVLTNNNTNDKMAGFLGIVWTLGSIRDFGYYLESSHSDAQKPMLRISPHVSVDDSTMSDYVFNTLSFFASQLPINLIFKPLPSLFQSFLFRVGLSVNFSTAIGACTQIALLSPKAGVDRT